MGSHTAFFYGTLMAREIIHRVCYGSSDVSHDPAKSYLASQLTIQDAILHDYCRHRVRYCDYPGILPEKGRTVRGTYVTGLTDGDIHRLDSFEGGEYERVKVKVELVREEAGKNQAEAETYVYCAGEQYLEKKEWDYEEFRREKMHRWTDESDEYQHLDEAIDSDPTGGRAAKTDTEFKEEKEPLKSAV